MRREGQDLAPPSLSIPKVNGVKFIAEPHSCPAVGRHVY